MSQFTSHGCLQKWWSVIIWAILLFFFSEEINRAFCAPRRSDTRGITAHIASFSLNTSQAGHIGGYDAQFSRHFICGFFNIKSSNWAMNGILAVDGAGFCKTNEMFAFDIRFGRQLRLEHFAANVF